MKQTQHCSTTIDMMPLSLLRAMAFLCTVVLVIAPALATEQSKSNVIATASPLQHPRRLRFALVDVGIQLSHVSSLMDYMAMGHLENACQVFLHQALNSNQETSITNIQVTVMAQTLGNSIYENEDGALLPKPNVNDELHSYTITTQQEIALEYELEMEDPFLNNMEVRIENIFATQADFLLNLLVIEKDSYFANVTTIQLFEKQSEDSSYFDQFGEDEVDESVGSNTPALSTSRWGTYGLIIVFVAAGLAVLLSIFTLHAILRSKCCQKASEGDRSTSTSRSNTGKQTISVTSIERHESDVKELGVYTSDDSEEVDEEAADQKPLDEDVSTLSRTVPPAHDSPYDEDLSTLSRTLPSVPSQGEIQPIYSEDKVHNPATLMNLRQKREQAAGKLKSTMSKYRDPSCGGDLASIADSCPDTSKERSFQTASTSLSSTRKQDTKRQDIENQIERLRLQRQAIEQRIKVKCDKLSKLNTSGSTVQRRNTEARGMEWIESVEQRLRLDGDSVSTMTGVHLHADDDEDSALDVMVDDTSSRPFGTDVDFVH